MPEPNHPVITSEDLKRNRAIIENMVAQAVTNEGLIGATGPNATSTDKPHLKWSPPGDKKEDPPKGSEGAPPTPPTTPNGGNGGGGNGSGNNNGGSIIDTLKKEKYFLYAVTLVVAFIAALLFNYAVRGVHRIADEADAVSARIVAEQKARSDDITSASQRRNAELEAYKAQVARAQREASRPLEQNVVFVKSVDCTQEVGFGPTHREGEFPLTDQGSEYRFGPGCRIIRSNVGITNFAGSSFFIRGLDRKDNGEWVHGACGTLAGTGMPDCGAFLNERRNIPLMVIVGSGGSVSINQKGVQ